MSDEQTATALLIRWRDGDERALDQLVPIVYDQLHRIARQYLSKERENHTLQPTALVNEAYLRLIDQRSVSWQNRAHFFAVASEIMRRLLIDHARRHKAEKRGAGLTIALEEGMDFPAQADSDLVAIDEALKTLALTDAQQARIVEMRFFGGMSVEETAEALQVSASTVKRDWRMARAWLLRELTHPAAHSPLS